MANFWKVIGEICDSYEELNEEKKEELRRQFESEKKEYNRGTVIAAMSEQDWSWFDMDQVLKEVTTPERAEAAVGLIKTGNYGWFDIVNILRRL